MEYGEGGGVGGFKDLKGLGRKTLTRDVRPKPAKKGISQGGNPKRRRQVEVTSSLSHRRLRDVAPKSCRLYLCETYSFQGENAATT